MFEKKEAKSKICSLRNSPKREPLNDGADLKPPPHRGESHYCAESAEGMAFGTDEDAEEVSSLLILIQLRESN